MGKPLLRGVLSLALMFALAGTLRAADDAFFDVPLDKLPVVEGTMPKLAPNAEWEISRKRALLPPYVVLDGPGEAYANLEETSGANTLKNGLFVRASAGQEVSGRLYLPNDDGSGMIALKFRLPASAASDAARAPFYLAMSEHYQRLLDRGIAGGAWFRHRLEEANGKGIVNSLPRFNRFTADDTYDLFSGNQALAENLQLDRALPAPAPAGSKSVALDTLEGITVAEMDWQKLVKDLKPEVDPLASCVPADQHAIFIPNWQSLMALADEGERSGTPLLKLAESGSQDALTRQRYERQLGLSLTKLGRLLGPRVIKSIAITGSDPYLRSGSDVAIILEPADLNTLKNLLTAQINLARTVTPGAQEVTGKAGALDYIGAQSPDRILRTFMAVLNDHAIVVTNSPAQLKRLADVQAGNKPALSAAPEYTFFRDRYKRGEDQESALIVLTDATIRRWCGPRWRIADSRRTRAAAVLSDLNATHLDELAGGNTKTDKINSNLNLVELGDLHLTSRGAESSIYGALDQLTPISELDFDSVSEQEAALYRRWRDTYQTNWRNFFDPIAVRLSVTGKKVAADMTIMPLIAGTEYRQFIDITRGAAIDPSAGDPHQTLLRIAMAINIQSQPMRQASGMAMQLAPNVKVDPLGWLGQSVAVFVDPDPFWDELAKSKKPQVFMQNNWWRMPVALRAEVGNGFKLTAFLIALHGFVDQSAPGMTLWESLTYKDHGYVKVSPSEQARGQNQQLQHAAIYYLATGDGLLLTPNEDLLKRAIDRQIDRDAAKAAGKEVPKLGQPILGKSLVLQADSQLFDLIEHGTRDELEFYLREQSWDNLPILNEWKRRYPKQDPVKLHEQFFQTRLLDPAGGQYVWNEKYQSMESTVYGCPAQPKPGPADLNVLTGLRHGNFGVTFEAQGLRAKAEVER